MADDDRRLNDAAERFDGYLEALLGDGRPSPESVEDRDEAEMARTAAEMAAGARTSSATGPDPAFVEQLRLRMREADAGIETVRTPPPVRDAQPQPEGIGRWRLSRRHVLQAGIGAAAGLAAGLAGVALRARTNPTGGTWDDEPLIGGEGFWTEVARMSDVPEGTALRFSTAAFEGFVVNDGGTVRALSSMCTHMGCTLHYRPDWHDLRCPCHGASFNMAGSLANGRRAWRSAGAYPGDARAYPLDLPDLARPEVKVEEDRILVWTAQA